MLDALMILLKFILGSWIVLGSLVIVQYTRYMYNKLKVRNYDLMGYHVITYVVFFAFTVLSLITLRMLSVN